ncbi:hypothetical protein TUM17382_22400 [Shewanella algae]|nr:hypothetical protein TUM17382_22400 [Shewanella algae]
MNGGKVMLLATIISAAFTANAATEVHQLTLTSSTVCEQSKHAKSRKSNTKLNKALSERLSHIKSITKEWREFYYQVSESFEAIEEEQYENLQSLAKTISGVTDYLKNIAVEERANIVRNYGDETYNLFRTVAAEQGQLKRCVLNVLALYDSYFEKCSVIEQTSFAPTAEFWKVATEATHKVYG